MRSLVFTSLRGAVLAAALLATSPASAYDPCLRAYQQETEAEDAFWRWCDNHTDPAPPGWSGSCGVSGRGAVLYNEWQSAVRARQRACS
jgi:hypothetical protein